MCPYPPFMLATQAGPQLCINYGYRHIHGYLLCWLYVSQFTSDRAAGYLTVILAMKMPLQ